MLFENLAIAHYIKLSRGNILLFNNRFEEISVETCRMKKAAMRNYRKSFWQIKKSS